LYELRYLGLLAELMAGQRIAIISVIKKPIFLCEPQRQRFQNDLLFFSLVLLLFLVPELNKKTISLPPIPIGVPICLRQIKFGLRSYPLNLIRVMPVREKSSYIPSGIHY
jgi:hypothetical protein